MEKKRKEDKKRWPQLDNDFHLTADELPTYVKNYGH